MPSSSGHARADRERQPPPAAHVELAVHWPRGRADGGASKMAAVALMERWLVSAAVTARAAARTVSHSQHVADWSSA